MPAFAGMTVPPRLCRELLLRFPHLRENVAYRRAREGRMHEALNHAKLAMLFRREFELCNVNKGETIVLLSDLGARRDYVSEAFAAAEDLGADAYEMCVNAMPSWTKVGVP